MPNLKVRVRSAAQRLKTLVSRLKALSSMIASVCCRSLEVTNLNQSGGPAGVIWGFIIVWCGTLSTFAVIAELASMLVEKSKQIR